MPSHQAMSNAAMAELHVVSPIWPRLRSSAITAMTGRDWQPPQPGSTVACEWMDMFAPHNERSAENARREGDA